VLSAPGDAVALVWHARLERWLQPGGHFEPVDRSAVAAARREVAEELGVTLGSAAPLVGVDVHAIPPARGEPAHWHHDLVFGFRLAEDVPVDGGAVPAEWCAVEALGHRGADEPLRRAVARTRLALAGVT
jgi:8-oxo-dGTP pyrophosphatase MutT (NUDIX family)